MNKLKERMYGNERSSVGENDIWDCKIFVAYSPAENIKTATKDNRGCLSPKNTANIPIHPLPTFMEGEYAPSLKTNTFPAQLAKKAAIVQDAILYLLQEIPFIWRTSGYLPTYLNLVPYTVYFKNKNIKTVNVIAINVGIVDVLSCKWLEFLKALNAIVFVLEKYEA